MRTAVAATICFVLLGLVRPVPGQGPSTQTLPPGYSNTGGNAVSSWPFNTLDDQKWQWVYDSSLFVQQGPMVIQELWLRFSSAGATSAGASIGDVTITLASSPNNYLANPAPPAGQDPVFANNLGPDATLVRTGPFVVGIVGGGVGVANWIPLGIASGFTYDPSLGLDLVVQVEKCGTAMSFGTTFDMVTLAPTQLGATRYGHLNDCAAVTRNNFANEAVLVMKLDYAPLAPTWQINQVAASLIFDGGISSGFAPITSARSVGQTVPVSMVSNLPGQPFDIGIGFQLGVPVGAGAITTPGGQILNLNVSDPSLSFLLGLQFTLPISNLTLPFALQTPATMSLQLVVLNPGVVDGFSLSALNTLIVTP